MGRDKPKKYGKMNYQQKSVYHDKLAKKYNINKDDFNSAQGGGGGRYDNLDEGAYQKAIKNAMRNDFDYRTSAQHMDKVKGEAGFDDFVKYERGAVKLHRKAGNEGDYSSNKDITGVTNNLVNDYRQDLEDRLTNLDDEQTEAAIKPDDNEVPYAESQQSKDAKATLEKWKAGLGAGGNVSPYGASSASAPNAPSPYTAEASDPVTTDVNEFVSGYKDDVKAAYRFKPTLS